MVSIRKDKDKELKGIMELKSFIIEKNIVYDSDKLIIDTWNGYYNL